MRHPLPSAAPGILRAALSTPAGLRAWWAPDARAHDGRAAPGLDAPEMRVAVEGAAVTWSGDALVARFDTEACVASLDATLPLDPHDRGELALAWEVALATLGWAVERAVATGALPAPTWSRRVAPLALAYTDAWGRIDGAEGLAGGPAGAPGAVRLGGARVPVRRRLVAPPRAVLADVGDGLVRVVFGPGPSVNAATLEALDPGAAGLPVGWDAALARRLGMSWAAQLGEEG